MSSLSPGLRARGKTPYLVDEGLKTRPDETETMARVEIYTTRFCPFCFAARRLLTAKKAAFREIDVTLDSRGRADMAERAGGRRTVPQIFIDGRHIGGCDDLVALDRAGRLDPLLAEPADG